MTANVISLLEQLKELEIFETHPLYFVGGTALAYDLEHRISEDIDIISAAPLPHRQITNTINHHCQKHLSYLTKHTACVIMKPY